MSTEAGEGLEKIEISGVTTITGKTFYNNPVVNDSCWVIETNSNTPFGVYKAKHYYHQKYGFVYFHYDFIQYKVEMNLVSFK